MFHVKQPPTQPINPPGKNNQPTNQNPPKPPKMTHQPNDPGPFRLRGQTSERVWYVFFCCFVVLFVLWGLVLCLFCWGGLCLVWFVVFGWVFCGGGWLFFGWWVLFAVVVCFVVVFGAPFGRFWGCLLLRFYFGGGVVLLLGVLLFCVVISFAIIICFFLKIVGISPPSGVL